MSNKPKQRDEFERKKRQDPEKRRQDIERKDPGRPDKAPVREPIEPHRGVKPSMSGE